MALSQCPNFLSDFRPRKPQITQDNLLSISDFYDCFFRLYSEDKKNVKGELELFMTRLVPQRNE